MAARFSDEGQPYYQLAKRTKSGPRWTGEVRFIPEHLCDPVRWQKARRIFVNSMSDIFHEGLTNEEIAAIFAVMCVAKRHKFQVLTKRSKRMVEWFRWAGRLTMGELFGCAKRALKDHPEELKAFNRADAELGGYTWPLPNVWIGVSVENQEAADERIPDLLRTPAEIRFLSCEPLIGRVSLAKWLRGGGEPVEDNPATRAKALQLGGGHVQQGASSDAGNVVESQSVTRGSLASLARPLLSWVIAGCESGPGMRDCDHQWLRVLREECRASGVKYFLKQARGAQEGGHRLYPSGQAARSPVVDVVAAGKGSKVKPGGVIERPYLDGFQHQEFPA